MHIKFDIIKDEQSEKLCSIFNNRGEFINVNPGNVIVPKKFEEIGQKILDLPVRKNDTWLVSYPRSGSTWAQEMVWLLGNNLNYEGAEKLQQFRSPILELTALLDQSLTKTIGSSVEIISNMPSPRFIRSHLPFPILPMAIDKVKPKIIYTARNPKDLCVSYYNYLKLLHGLTGTFEDFCELFLSESVPMGSIWNHMFGFWNKRNESNVLFIKYEDMKQDIRKVIRQCAKFLEVESILTPEAMNKLCEYLSFESMQKNRSVNIEPIIENNTNIPKDLKFIRKGQIGDWKNFMSVELSERFDKWIEEKTKGTGLNFTYE